MKEYNFKINGNEYKVTIDTVEGGKAAVNVNGTDYNVEIGEQLTPKVKKPVQVAPATYQATPTIATPSQPVSAPAAAGAGMPLKSPLPGVILEMKVNVGDSVTEGQTLLVLEAMKMENNIDAPKSGVIKSISKSKGDSVLEGDLLLTIE